MGQRVEIMLAKLRRIAHRMTSRKEINQPPNIVGSLVQGGYPNGKNIDAVEEIRAKLPGLNARFEIAVGGANQPHVHFDDRQSFPLRAFRECAAATTARRVASRRFHPGK